MSDNPISSIEAHFGELEDPRIDRCKEHKLMDIIVIAICAVICGAEGWTDIAEFGRAKETWLKKFLELPNGIPSHDTFGRVFSRLNAEGFQSCFLAWIKAVQAVTKGQVIALDGKELRRSLDGYLGKAAIHMVSAWASENGLVLAQRQVDSKSNEITAIPALLKTLEIAGCIITIDAIGCQKEIARQIIEQQGDYVLAVKQNQPHLYEDLDSQFRVILAPGSPPLSAKAYQRTVDKDHGRIEIRECWTLPVSVYQSAIRNVSEWQGIQSLVLIRSERRLKDKTELHDRYFISSLPPKAAQLLQAVRDHWGIENSVHWVLDLAFNEDRSRIRKDHAPANFATIRHMALNFLRNEKSAKVGVKAKRLKAAWDDAYFLKVLSSL
jgi:predicted transposase YbfD/YdcC